MRLSRLSDQELALVGFGRCDVRLFSCALDGLRSAWRSQFD